MHRSLGLSAHGGAWTSLALVLGITIGGKAHAQASADQPSPAATSQPEQEITVTAQRLNEARQNIEPSVGASTYNFSNQTIQNMPGGENAGLNQVLLQAPGVTQDNLANGAFHIRNEHLNNIASPASSFPTA